MAGRRVKTISVKNGASPTERKVLASVTGVTAAPSVPADGYLTNQAEWAHLLFSVSGTDPVFRLRIWWYSTITGTWHKGRQVVVNASDLVSVEVLGLDRVYLQVETAPSGSSPVLDAWVAVVRPLA